MTLLRKEYPNIAKLYDVILVLCLANAPVESGFSHMAATKRQTQSQMSPERLDMKLRIKILGANVGTPEAAAAIDYAAEQFLMTKRVPMRRNGAIAAAGARKENAAAKRKREATQVEDQTAKNNAAILATGSCPGTLPAFERAGYSTLPCPDDTSLIEGSICARALRVSDKMEWVIGKITNIRKSEQKHQIGGPGSAKASRTKPKTRFDWTSSDGHRGGAWGKVLDATKIRLSKSNYSIHWVLLSQIPTGGAMLSQVTEGATRVSSREGKGTNKARAV